jgi:alpha-beta hydrolase superfamily lysophospholipase
MSRRNRPLRYLGTFAGGVAVGALGIAAYTTRQLNGPARQTISSRYGFTPWEVQATFEPVAFVTADGITLRGWWLAREGATATIITCTGHRGVKSDLLGIGSALWRAGNNVLLFDFRGCGESDPAPLSVGFYELGDLRAALAHARERTPDLPLGLIGYSMGAAIALMVAADDPTVRAVVADSSYAAIGDVIAAAYRRRRVPTTFLLAASDRYNGWRYGYRFGALRPVDVVARLAPRPLLIIHGEADDLTPVEHAHRLYAAARDPRELWIVPNTPHCGAYFADRPRYVNRVADFFARSLTAASPSHRGVQ